MAPCHCVSILALGSVGDGLPLLAVAYALNTSYQQHVDSVLHTATRLEIDVVLSHTAYGILRPRWETIPETHRQGITVHRAPEDDAKVTASCDHTTHDMKVLWSFCQGKSTAVIFNYFSLAGYSIAERMGVPAILCSPSLPPYSSPPGFMQAFMAEFPACAQYTSTISDDDTVSRLKLGLPWSHIPHWGWRMFLDDYGDARCRVLSLPMSPWECCLDPTPTSTEDNNYSSNSSSSTSSSSSSGHTCIPVLLCYGIDPLVASSLPRYQPARTLGQTKMWFGEWTLPSSIPPGIHAGVVRDAEDKDSEYSTVTKQLLPPLISRYIDQVQARDLPEGAGCHILGVSFGSMLGMYTSQLCGVLVVLCELAQEYDLPVLVLLQQDDSAECDNDSIHSALSDVSPTAGLLVYSGYVPYELLLPHLSILVHHGGAGTTAACRRHDCPQFVIPFIYDQVQWGRWVERTGRGQALRDCLDCHHHNTSTTTTSTTSNNRDHANSTTTTTTTTTTTPGTCTADVVTIRELEKREIGARPYLQYHARRVLVPMLANTLDNVCSIDDGVGYSDRQQGARECADYIWSFINAQQ